MVGVLGLKDVSEEDIDRKTGEKSKLKTGSKRSHNMPKECVKKKIAAGMSPKAAHAACYPKPLKSEKVDRKAYYKKFGHLHPDKTSLDYEGKYRETGASPKSRIKKKKKVKSSY